jgi:N-dimethylarginine dimethylaminohydrolase
MSEASRPPGSAAREAASAALGADAKTSQADTPREVLPGTAGADTRSEREGSAHPAGTRWILMGDPRHFSVKGGANPHTRTRWGTRRRVDRERAIAQWHRLHDTLRDLGLRILVVPPDPAQPGLVYPANAGFMRDVDEALPRSERVFYLANLLPTRAGEKAHYERVLAETDLRTEVIDESLRFEGEADFFPVGDRYLLTHGELERQRFVPAWSLPPWKRVYGFRTDLRVVKILAPLVAPKAVQRIELVLEAHYHGDTALCAFGPRREHLLVYRNAVTPRSWHQLKEAIGEALLELSEPDAQRYAANSFTYTAAGSTDPVLVMPDGLSDRLLDQIRDRGVTPITVDVSEFLKKGGGSVKCMIGDLGLVVSEDHG